MGIATDRTDLGGAARPGGGDILGGDILGGGGYILGGKYPRGEMPGGGNAWGGGGGDAQGGYILSPSQRVARWDPQCQAPTVGEPGCC